jgi:glycosyltransferase involved in cell wall biosynthesis
VDPEDPIAFAAAVRRLVSDRALTRQLGERARQLAEQRFGQDAVLRTLEQELEALVGRPRGR